MATASVSRPDVSREEAMQAVRQEMGQDYTVEAGGQEDVFLVKQGMMVGARVRITRDAGATKFHVHGTGLIIGRLINEVTIARRVASVIAKAPLGQEPGPQPAGS